jgi:hypothetical protein
MGSNKVILVLCLLLASARVWAVDEYYSLSRSIRSLGMGGAFYGLSDDEYALFYNPAGLARYRGKGQLMLGINTQMATASPSAISQIISLKGAGISTIVTSLNSFDGTPIYAGVGLLPYYLTKNFAVGLLLADTKVQMAILGNNFDTSVDLTAISDSGLVIGYARPLFTEGLYLGLNTKAIFRAGGHKSFSVLDIAQNSNFDLNPRDLGGLGMGIDFDLGATYELPPLGFGVSNAVSLTFTNLLASQMMLALNYGSPPTLERMGSIGLHSVLAGWGGFDNFHLLLDFAEFDLGGEPNYDFGDRIGSFWKHVNFGVEAPMDWLVLRAGFHQGNFTAGVGIRTFVAQIDLATYGEELFQGVGRLSSRRVALRIALGAGSPPPPPIYSDHLVLPEKPVQKPPPPPSTPLPPTQPESQPQVPAAPAVAPESGQMPPATQPPMPTQTPTPSADPSLEQQQLRQQQWELQQQRQWEEQQRSAPQGQPPGTQNLHDLPRNSSTRLIAARGQARKVDQFEVDKLEEEGSALKSFQGENQN